MMKQIVLAAAIGVVSLAFGACSTSKVEAIDWNRPFKPWTGPAPVFLHNLAIANGPHPFVVYENYEDEPTRFIFRPRNVIYEETDNGTGGGDEGYVDYGYYDMGGGGGGGGEE
jgi:hypothetical protein